MNTPLLDGIRKEALFPRSLRALTQRMAWHTKHLLRRKGRPSAMLGDFVKNVKNMGLDANDDIIHGAILRRLIRSKNELIAQGARPAWKLPKKVPLFHVSSNQALKNIIPSPARSVDRIWSPGLKGRSRGYFTIGAPTKIFGKQKPHVSQFMTKALRNRGVYIDPLDAVADIANYTGSLKNIDWDKLRLSMMFTGRPARLL